MILNAYSKLKTEIWPRIIITTDCQKKTKEIKSLIKVLGTYKKRKFINEKFCIMRGQSTAAWLRRLLPSGWNSTSSVEMTKEPSCGKKLTEKQTNSCSDLDICLTTVRKRSGWLLCTKLNLLTRNQQESVRPLEGGNILVPVDRKQKGSREVGFPCILQTAFCLICSPNH